MLWFGSVQTQSKPMFNVTFVTTFPVFLDILVILFIYQHNAQAVCPEKEYSCLVGPPGFEKCCCASSATFQSWEKKRERRAFIHPLLTPNLAIAAHFLPLLGIQGRGDMGQPQTAGLWNDNRSFDIKYWVALTASLGTSTGMTWRVPSRQGPGIRNS